MKEVQLKPVLQLRYGGEVSIDAFATQHQIQPSDIINDLKNILREHYGSFHTKPFNLTYSPASGYMVDSTPVVGVMAGRILDVELLPKLPHLSLGKCLGMAQQSGNQSVSFVNKKPVAALISDETDYSSMAYIALSFFDAVNTVVRNGIARRFNEVLVSSRKIEGTINIQESLAQGNEFLAIQDVIEPDKNIFPNRFIMTAIQFCREEIRDERISRGFAGLLAELDGIAPYNRVELERLVFFHEFTIPRDDYKRCMSLANAILTGKTFEGFGGDKLPSFTLDLDLIFEQYCSTQIDVLMSKGKFVVELQKEHLHDIHPRLTNKTIVPDIVIQDRTSGQQIVLDVKNKYSRLRDDGALDISNPDLYQLTYYLKTLSTNKGVLVYT